MLAVLVDERIVVLGLENGRLKRSKKKWLIVVVVVDVDVDVVGVVV